MYRFPSDPVTRQLWLTSLNLKNEDVKEHHRICSHHFPNGDKTQVPSITLYGERFASPKKMHIPRGKRAVQNAQRKQLLTLKCGMKHVKSSPSPTPSISRAITPASSDDQFLDSAMPLSTQVGEPLMSDYSVHELPDESGDSAPSSSFEMTDHTPQESDVNVIVNTALVARIEHLEAEKSRLLSEASNHKPKKFRIEHISDNDSLIHFYTGFHTYELLLNFFEFLGPSVSALHYWGGKAASRRKRSTKLDPFNQLFLTLVKLRLNLKERDLAYRFGVSTSLVSKYFITWVCFLYHHLSEIQWMPTVEQVRGCMPHSFKEKYPNTYAIIDASEVFLETPTDLQMQSSTWSNYKHHNTAKFLVACTPNGAVCFVSPLYVGGISDVELTRVSGFIEKLDDKSGVSIMADRGFTIQDQLKAVGVGLNIPPFMEGRKQLPPEEVLRGRQIASLRIHVERIIGRIKNYTILKSTLPLSMSRIANQIVSVCSWLVNFQPILIPPPPVTDDQDIEHYFQTYYGNTDSDYDADSEQSDSSDHDQES